MSEWLKLSFVSVVSSLVTLYLTAIPSLDTATTNALSCAPCPEAVILARPSWNGPTLPDQKEEAGNSSSYFDGLAKSFLSSAATSRSLTDKVTDHSYQVCIA